MNITLTLQVNNKQGVWLSIVGFFKVMNCQLEIKNVVEQGEQSIITVEVISKKPFTEANMHRLESFSKDVLSVKKEGEHVDLTTNLDNSHEIKVHSAEPEVSNSKAQEPAEPDSDSNGGETVPQQAGSYKLIAFTAIVLITVGVFFGFQQDQVDSEISEPKVNVDESKNKSELSAALTEPTDLISEVAENSISQAEREQDKKTSVDKLQTQISTLLAKAEQAIAGSDLTEISIGQALQQYRQVLDLSPENPDAQAGLERVARVYIDLSDQALSTSNFDQAQDYLRQADFALPENGLVEQAQQRLQAQQTEYQALKEKNEKITELLAQADAAYKSKRFSKPAGNNAINFYRAALGLDANNDQAKQGLKNVANSYLQLAMEAINKRELDRAETYISQSSVLDPAAEKLSKVKKQFDKAKVEQEQKTVEDEQIEGIEKLLSKATVNLKAARLHSPKDNNALANYRSVLVLQPDNKQALTGLELIVAADLKLAQAAIDNQQLSRAETFIQQAESVLPNAVEVQSMRQRLQQANNKAVVVKEVPTEPEQVVESKQTTSTEVNNKPSGQIVVIVHPSNPLSEISSSQLKKIYNGQQENWDTGGKIVLLNQVVDSSVRARFYRAVLGVTPETTFKKSYFGSSGQVPLVSKERATDSEVKKFIRRNKKGIGYIYLSNIDDSVKALKINGNDPSSNNYLLR